MKCSSPPFPHWAHWRGLLLDRAGVECFQNPPPQVVSSPFVSEWTQGARVVGFTQLVAS